MIQLLAILVALQAGQVTLSHTADAGSGNVIRLDGQPFRLWGVTTPRPGVLCTDDGGDPYDCDEAARDVLQNWIRKSNEELLFLAGQMHTQYADVRGVRCEAMGQDEDGTVVGRCAVLTPYCIPQQAACQDRWTDLAAEVIASGTGVQKHSESGGIYDEQEQAACYGALGVWGVSDDQPAARHEPSRLCDGRISNAR